MYDLESGVSPNEGCTGSLHTHKNPGWTSKRIRFGDAGIKGRSEERSLPAQHRARPSAAAGSEAMLRARTRTAQLRRTVGGGTVCGGENAPKPTLLLRETLRCGNPAAPRGRRYVPSALLLTPGGSAANFIHRVPPWRPRDWGG